MDLAIFRCAQKPEFIGAGKRMFIVNIDGSIQIEKK
jgi:hypothetical protein